MSKAKGALIEPVRHGFLEPGYEGGLRLRLVGKLDSRVVDWLRTHKKVVGLRLIDVEADEPGTSWDSANSDWANSDWDLLHNLPLRELSICSRRRAPSAAEWLTKSNTLRALSIMIGVKGGMDLSGFPNLRYLAVDCTRATGTVIGLHGLRKLECVCCVGAKSELLGQLTGGPSASLRSVELKDFRGTDIAPVLRCRKLIHLAVQCRRFSAVRGTSQVAQWKALQYLSLYHVDVGGTIAAFGRLPRLRWLGLESCGDLQTLRPLASMKQLRAFLYHGKGRVLDGDLRVLINPKLVKVWLQNKTGYLPRATEVCRMGDVPPPDVAIPPAAAY